MSQNYDVMILGAGPAGSSCALHLRSAGLKVGLLDKHTFPRDKVCGDAIPGRAIRCLQSIFPDLPAALDGFQEKLLTQRTVCYFNKKQLEFNWSLEAYTSARMHFDHFLHQLVKAHTDTTVIEGIEAKQVTRSSDGYTITTRNYNGTYHCKLLIGADGVNGISARQLTGYHIDRDHHVASVRA